MRMSQSGESAADFLNNAPEQEIADVIYRYGEEHRSRRIARAIVDARPLSRTGAPASIVRKAVGYRTGDKKDPATRTVQAFRTHPKRELEELERGPEAAEAVLEHGGSLAIDHSHGRARGRE